MVVFPMEELLLETYDVTSNSRYDRKNITQILSDCGYHKDRITKRDTNEMGNLLRKHGFTLARKDYKLYAVPQNKIDGIKGYIDIPIPR